MKSVFSFGEGKAEGDPTRRDLLGGKGAGLAEMTSLGLPVPPGFTISTDACRSFSRDGKIPQDLGPEVDEALGRLEKQVGFRFGDPKAPLLVSVRSGARASMPGMMDTILNLGLNDETAKGLIERTGNARFVLDAYRRFLAMYSDVALGVHREHFEKALDEARARVGKEKGLDPTRMNSEELRKKVTDADIPEAELALVVAAFKQIVRDKTGHDFPSDPKEQLWGAITAVFKSWMNPRAHVYRKMHDIPESWGTACNIQAMVFGNLGDTSATGVAFTRDPSTGERRLYGEWLPNAQGEDVVAGIRTPLTLRGDGDTLEKKMPEAFTRLVDIADRLEKHFRDVQDLEFTIQDGKLYMLQCRSAKRTGPASVRIAVEMTKEGLVTREEALLRVDPHSLDQLLHPTLDPSAPKKLLARGLPASPGAAQGKIVFSADEAERRAGQGEPVILVRVDTSPEDIHGMKAARGILTARGGMTCIAGETRVLTNLGLLTAEETFARFEEGTALTILSFDARTMRPVWRDIIATGKRPAEVLTVSVSHADGTMRLTGDHKMYVVASGALVKKPLERVLADGSSLIEIGRFPDPIRRTSPALRSDLETLRSQAAGEAIRPCSVKQVAGPEPATVYNFEVDAADEIDKCFVVFSSRMTPVLVSNSHAAVVARGMGKPCVAGCSALAVNYAEQKVAITQYDDDGRSHETVFLKKGDIITIDGGAGHVYAGAVPTVSAALTGEFGELMGWADEIRKMKVRANADTPLDARTARAFGAEGIGLCRTEHMFFDEERIRAMREMILAEDLESREKALAKLLPVQKQDFVEIFREMKGLPVTIRLLDPPLHEFLPTEKKQIEELSGLLSVSVSRLEQRIKDLHEFNPMLGHRGCRLAITYPEIYAMQVRAILEAADEVSREGSQVLPEIMIPLAMTKEELVRMRQIVDRVAGSVFENRTPVPFLFGTMIELPRAAVRAGQLAQAAEFFSFGTNDLTQCTMGLSRDDAGKFLPAYVETGILAKDPFVTIDVDGVGALVKLAVERGRAQKPGLKLGVCGEHGGDPESIRFFRDAQLDYVSCSPFRVTIARLAAAQAEVLAKKGRASITS